MTLTNRAVNLLATVALATLIVVAFGFAFDWKVSSTHCENHFIITHSGNVIIAEELWKELDFFGRGCSIELSAVNGFILQSFAHYYVFIKAHPAMITEPIGLGHEVYADMANYLRLYAFEYHIRSNFIKNTMPLPANTININNTLSILV
jgi:hypothetical protein